MNRILITGNAGSGKTTTANLVASELDIPYHCLDRIVWQTGWQKTPRTEVEQAISELTNQPRWVIDGVSLQAQAQSDTVVFLDIPRRVSFLRVFRRNWRYLFRSRPDLPDGCPEILIIPRLLKIIWNFPTKIRPRILTQAKRQADKHNFYHIKNEDDLTKFLTTLDDRKSR